MCLRCEERFKGVMLHRMRFGEGGGPEALKKGDLGFPGGFASYSRFQQYRNPLGRALHRGEARFAGASPVQRGADGSPGLPLLRSSADSKFKGRNGECARAASAAAAGIRARPLSPLRQRSLGFVTALLRHSARR
jgi:hypothetical protein